MKTYDSSKQGKMGHPDIKALLKLLAKRRRDYK